MLVELAQERDEDIPALVYEARSTRQPRRLPHTRQQPQPRQRHSSTTLNAQQHDDPSAALQEVTVAQSGNIASGDRLQACCRLAPCRPGHAVLHSVWCVLAYHNAVADSANTGTNQLSAQQCNLLTDCSAPGSTLLSETCERAQHNVVCATGQHQIWKSRFCTCRGGSSERGWG